MEITNSTNKNNLARQENNKYVQYCSKNESKLPRLIIEFLKNEKLCVFIVMVHKICQKFYKSALFPKNNALLFSKSLDF